MDGEGWGFLFPWHYSFVTNQLVLSCASNTMAVQEAAVEVMKNTALARERR